MGVDYGAIDALAGLHATKAGIDAQNAQALQAQTINANAAGAAAATALDQARATALPLASAADIAKTQADAAVARQQAKYFGQTALGQIGLQTATANKYIADTQSTNVDTGLHRILYGNKVFQENAARSGGGIFNGTPAPAPTPTTGGMPGADPYGLYTSKK